SSTASRQAPYRAAGTESEPAPCLVFHLPENWRRAPRRSRNCRRISLLRLTLDLWACPFQGPWFSQSHWPRCEAELRSRGDGGLSLKMEGLAISFGRLRRR